MIYVSCQLKFNQHFDFKFLNLLVSTRHTAAVPRISSPRLPDT